MKVLLIRFSSIGDIVLCTPVARCLKNQAGATVHFLTKRIHSDLLRPNPNIDRIFTFDKNISEVVPMLKAEQYDYIVDLHHNLRSMRVKLALGRPSAAFEKLNFEKWLLVQTGLDFLPATHIVFRYLDAARYLGVVYDGQGLDHFIPAEAQVSLAHRYPSLTPNGYIAFVIGATHATKRMPQDKMLEICRQLPHPVAILGGRQESAVGAYLATNGGGQVVDLCGQLSIHESASVVAQSKVVLSHDTGLMHIAAALRKPVLSVWGSTVPKFGMYPFYPEGMHYDNRVEINDLSCRPCSKIGYSACPKGHFRCMRDINSSEIVEKLNSFF